MLREEDAIRLRHMLEAAEEAVGYAAAREIADLESDRQLTHSLVRCVEIIGEAASRVSDECCEQHPEIRWRGITGMRNRLIHAYFDVNLNILWRSVTDELPPLIAQLRRILES
jgi:uncharacterized protein with HEPN domain